MKFSDKELDMIIAKKIDKVAFYAGERMIFTVDFNQLIASRFEEDPTLKKQLLQLVLESEE